MEALRFVIFWTIPALSPVLPEPQRVFNINYASQYFCQTYSASIVIFYISYIAVSFLSH